MCMWTSRQRRKLEKRARSFDAVIVLGCDSATATVRDLMPAGVKVIEGMRVAGIMNARLTLRPPADLGFDDCRIVPLSQR